MRSIQSASYSYALVFFLSFSILIGSGYNTYLSYERFYNVDSETYINIAKLNFTNQSLIRKYRILVPVMANAVSVPINSVYYKLVSDKRDKYDWPLLTGFFLINSIIMALAALLIYKIMEFQHLNKLSCAVGLLAFVAGGRWAGFIAAHPVTDSLTILSIAAIVYSLLKPNSILLAAGIIIGMISKESVALFFPMVILFSSKQTRITALISIPAALLIYFSIKYFIDHASGTSSVASLSEDFDSINSITFSIRKLFSAKGAADIFSVYGFFSLLILSGMFYKRFRKLILPSFNLLFIIFALTIFVHMLLSTELARMFYLGSALFVPFLAKCFEVHPWLNKIESDQSTNGKGHI